MFVTRPIVPPWDEASKNFAFELASAMKSYRPTLLTKGVLDEFKGRFDQLPIYTNEQLNLRQKSRLLKLSAQAKKFDILHYLFTPTPANTKFFKSVIRNKQAKTVQTVATVRTDLYSEAQLRKIFIGDAVVVYSEAAKKRLQKLGVKRIVKIYPGIDLDKYAPAKPSTKLSKRLGISDKDFVVAYPGEYTRLGATDLLKKSLPDLVDAIPNLKMIFACRIKNQNDKQAKASLIEHFQKEGLEKHVVFTDTEHDMAAFYNSCDIVLFPVTDMSGKFDIPLIIVEAMACGKPLIVSDLKTFSEFTFPDTALIVKAGDHNDFVQGVIKLHTKPDLSKELAKNARQYVLDNFDIKKIAKAYEKLYTSLLGENSND
ncbi:MAG: glycosyltransferase family 4 protein [Candidatus Saccharimonadales bacterium]|nr:glycosyltransferase family 4 protein [Candidatus Saccharimonadales bacterium]